MTNYPIFRIPENFKNINSEEIPVPDQPTPPNEPYKETKSAWNFLVLLIPLLLIQAYLKASIEAILITGAIGITFIIIYSIKFTIEENKTQKENLKFHKFQLKNFKNELAEYKELVNKIRNPEDTKKFRSKRIKEEIFNTTLPWGESPNLNKGYSEDYFYRFLCNRFPNNIYRDIILEDFGSNRSYQPDFIFQDQDTFFHIDIEIDEPYIKKSKEPIHFLENDIHIDKERDDFFTSNGWLVIRFAEEQVIKYPERCCNYIAKVIYEFTEKNEWLTNENLSLQEVKAWSYEKALSLTDCNYREVYFEEKKTAPTLYYNTNKPEILLVDSFDYEDEYKEMTSEYDDELPF